MTDRAEMGLGTEVDFLFAALRVNPDARQLRAVAARVTDWGFVVQAALKNRVVPLVYEALRAMDFEPVPDDQRAEIERWFQRSRLANLAHVREMLGLISDLEARDLRASPYKGPVLAEALYDDLGQREFHDLDLVVEEAALDQVREVVCARGFETESEPDHEDCEWLFRRASDDMLVEVHWDVLPARYRQGFEVRESYWERLVPFSLFGADVRVLAPEDLLIVLCIHGGEKHRWVRLQMIADIARLFAVHTGLDWDVVLERARKLGREHTVLFGAYLAWVLLDAPLDPRIVRLAQTPAIRADSALTVGRVARLDSGLSTKAEWRRVHRALDDRARVRQIDPGGSLGGWRYLAAVMRPEWTDYQALHLPTGLTWLYYIYRPLRLLRRHGLRLLRRV